MNKQSLYNFITQIKDESELKELIEISLTPKEQEMIEERWRILAALDKGLTQREVAKQNACSVVTVTRGAKVYRSKKEPIQKWLNKLGLV